MLGPWRFLSRSTLANSAGGRGCGFHNAGEIRLIPTGSNWFHRVPLAVEIPFILADSNFHSEIFHDISASCCSTIPFASPYVVDRICQVAQARLKTSASWPWPGHSMAKHGMDRMHGISWYLGILPLGVSGISISYMSSEFLSSHVG
jgi:hypothetical protein